MNPFHTDPTAYDPEAFAWREGVRPGSQESLRNFGQMIFYGLLLVVRHASFELDGEIALYQFGRLRVHSRLSDSMAWVARRTLMRSLPCG